MFLNYRTLLLSIFITFSAHSSQPERYHLSGKLVADYYESDRLLEALLPLKPPVVMLLGGSEGDLWENDDTVEQLLLAGFNVLAVGYFAVKEYPDLPPLLNRIELTNFQELISQVASQNPDFNNDCVGIIGVSKGGELALTLSSKMSNVRSVVAMVPANVVFQGLPVVANSESFFVDLVNTLTLPEDSSWLYKGSPLPYVPVEYFSTKTIWAYLEGEYSYVDTFQRALNKLSDYSAKIEVEKINGPILLISAIRDEIWPSFTMSESAYKRLQRKGFQYKFKHSSYDEDHGLSAEAYLEGIEFIKSELPNTCSS